MPRKTSKPHWIMQMLGSCMVLTTFFPTCAGAQGLLMKPDKVHIGTFFDGQRVAVSGEISPASQAVFEVIGKVVEQDLMRKGRRWELWMNVKEIDIDGVPNFYQALSSDSSLLSDSIADYPWGYEALRRTAVFSGRIKESDATKLFDEFVRLKESQELYGLQPGAVKILASSDGRTYAEADVHFRSRVPPGTYKICLSTIRDGQVLEHHCASMQVALVGFPALLSSLALGNPLLYGSMAVVLALVAGFATGILFKRLKSPQAKMGDQC